MPSGTDLAQYYIQIIPSADGIGGNIVNAIEKGGTGEKAGESLKSGMLKKLTSLAIWTSVGKIVGDGIREGAKLEQSIGGIEQVFGKDSEATKQLIKNSQNAFASAQVSANDYLQQVTMFSARLLQGLGGDTEAAVKYSDMAIKQMSDNANTFGTDLSSIQNAYQGFAKANWTMLDNLRLGYGGTASEMARLVNDSGVLGDTFTATASNINQVSFDKIIEAIQVVQNNMNITGKTSLEASTTISGSFTSMQAAVKNFLAYLTTGGDVSGAMVNVIDTFISFAGQIGKVALNIVKALPEVAKTLYTKYAPVIVDYIKKIAKQIWDAFINKIGDWANVGKNIINGIINGIKSAASNLVSSVVGAAQNALNGVKKFLGIKSPSKVFAEVGKFIDLGLAQGIEDNTKPITNAMDDVQNLFGVDIGAKPYLSAVGSDFGQSNAQTNYGGVSINVYAQDGQTAREIADEVADILQSQININKAVFQ